MTFSAEPRPEPRWAWYAWQQLDPDTLYGLLKLRSDIFVVEQNCVFSEMDGLDRHCEHLVARDADQRVIACLRLVPPGVKADEPSIGRVVVDSAWRGGTGRALMLRGMAACGQRHPRRGILLSSQQHLQGFYESLGFAPIGPVYLEDGIPHIDMRRPPQR